MTVLSEQFDFDDPWSTGHKDDAGNYGGLPLNHYERHSRFGQWVDNTNSALSGARFETPGGEEGINRLPGFNPPQPDNSYTSDGDYVYERYHSPSVFSEQVAVSAYHKPIPPDRLVGHFDPRTPGLENFKPQFEVGSLWWNKHHAETTSLMINKEHRGQGLANQLLKQAHLLADRTKGIPRPGPSREITPMGEIATNKMIERGVFPPPR